MTNTTERAEGITQDIAIITGPAGAGRSTALNALEDMGFETVDNLPLSMIDRLVRTDAPGRPLAIGTDPRTRDFTAEALSSVKADLDRIPGITVSLVYLDCDTDTLLRRFSETRRRHPLAPHGTPLSGIEEERRILAPLVATADVLIDTSRMSPHDLREEISRWFSRARAEDLSVSVQSFSFKRGAPRSADMVIDCRFLQNPHWVEDLRPLTGRDKAVADFVAEDALYKPFFEQTMALLALLLPAYKSEGKAYFTLAFGCTGGKHRSVCVAEAAAFQLAQSGWQVSIRHKELEHASGEATLRDVVKT